MPEYDNTVLPQTPSKSHNIYLLSLYDLNKTIFDLYKHSLGSTVNNKAERKFKSYIWDLYDLAEKLQLSKNNFGHYTIPETAPWRAIYVKNFNDDTGSRIYNNLRNFFPLAVNNHPIFSGQRYSGGFSFSPLINIAISDYTDILSTSNPTFNGINQFFNDQAAAEFLVYLACKIPMFPMMICSSVASQYSFGPVFLTSMNFSVSGDGDLSTVDVECSFEGGKAIISPEITLLNKRKPGIEPIVYNQMKDLEGNNINENASNFLGLNYDYHRYRSATLLDVIIDEKYHPTYLSLKSTINTLKPPAYKIVNFNLRISQTTDLTFTNPIIEKDNSLIYMGDKFGPKFASLTNREVSGTITYFGYNRNIEAKLSNSTGLSVYLGGPFFFALKNVDWSNPSVRITPGGGYNHTYNFNARLPEFDTLDNIHVQAPNENLTGVFSEFSGSSVFNVQDYISSLIKNVFGISY
jgi:hypothetical protein